MGVSYDVRRNDRVGGNREDTAVSLALRGFFQSLVYFFRGNAAIDQKSKVRERTGNGRNAHRDAVKFSFELRQGLGDGNRRSRGRWHDIVRGRTRAAGGLVRTILEVLVLRIGMDGAHHSFFDTEILKDHGRDGTDRIGRAGGVGNDLLALVFLVVHAEQKSLDVALAGSRRGNNHPARAGLYVHARSAVFGKNSRAFQNAIHFELWNAREF